MSQSSDRVKTESRKHNHAGHIGKPKHAHDEVAGQTLLEFLFLSLGGYIGAIGGIIAYQKNLPLRSIGTRVSGKLDTGVPMGRFQNNRNGFPRISVKVRIDADMSSEEKRNFLHEVAERCFVSESFKTLAEFSIDPE